MFDKISGFCRKYPDRVSCAVIAAVTLLCFIPSLRYELFAFDDSAYVGSPWLFELSWGNIKYLLASKTVKLYSPLVMLSFVPDYLIWGGEYFYAGCRFQNILWHAGAMILFYLTLRELGVRCRNGVQITFPPPAALFAALTAAIHPQRVESVVWIAERKDCIVMALGLASIYLFIKSFKVDRVSFAAPVLLFISLIAVKPLMISVPLILTVGYLASNAGFSWKDFFRKFSLIYGAVLLYVLLNLDTYIGFSKGAAAAAAAGGTAGENRIFIACYNIWRYIAKTFFPVELNPLYPCYQPGDVSGWTALLLLLAAAAVIGCSLIPSRWREVAARTIVPAVLMFGAAVLPVCNLKRIGNADFTDRYSYFPSLFIWMSVAAVLVLIYRKYPACRRFCLAFPAVLTGVMFFMTLLYMPAWQSEKSQLDAMLDTETPHFTALKLAAVAAFKQNEPDTALSYVALLKAKDTSRSGQYFADGMLGLIMIRRGQTDAGMQLINGFLCKPDWNCIADAPKEFIRNCLVSAGKWHLEQPDEKSKLYAANLFEMASQLIGEWSKLESLNFLGIACMIRGELDRAEAAFTAALKFAPDDSNIRKNLDSVRKRRQLLRQ